VTPSEKRLLTLEIGNRKRSLAAFRVVIEAERRRGKEIPPHIADAYAAQERELAELRARRAAADNPSKQSL
jgi:hypothetical protein